MSDEITHLSQPVKALRYWWSLRSLPGIIGKPYLRGWSPLRSHTLRHGWSRALRRSEFSGALSALV